MGFSQAEKRNSMDYTNTSMQAPASENRVMTLQDSRISKSGSQAIKVCIRVRPMLPRERSKDEVIYFPSQNSNNLEGIKVADG